MVSARKSTLPRISFTPNCCISETQRKCRKTLKWHSDEGQSLAELVVCLPILLLIIISLTQYGYIRHISSLIKTASYIGASTACNGSDGLAAVKEYLISNNVDPEKDIQIQITRKISAANYYEATVSLSGKTGGLVSKIFPERYQLEKSSRMYYSKKYVKTDDQWSSDGDKPLYVQ